MKLIKLIYACSFIILTSNANANNLNTSLVTCTNIKINTDRLACFDQLMSKYKVQSDITGEKATVHSKIYNNKNKENVNKPTLVPKANIVNEFGAAHLQVNKDKAEENTSIILTISKIKKNAYKQLVISFKNGQIWQQKDSGYFKLKSGEEVKLTKGALGAIYLKKNDENSNRSIRVKRVK